MTDALEAHSVTLRSRKPLAPPFHRHIAKGKLVGRDCRTGDRVVIYEIVATEPDGVVHVTSATRLLFE
jgi:mRNA-degrading endonuclease YafQ of YafQ-DinJ toxin-antitoxin module